MNKKTHHTIRVQNKKYPYTLEKRNSRSIFVSCPAAKLEQSFLQEDLVNLLFDLPHLILAEKEHQKSSETIQLRIPPEMKSSVEKKAYSQGHTSVSSYLREIIEGSTK